MRHKEPHEIQLDYWERELRCAEIAVETAVKQIGKIAHTGQVRMELVYDEAPRLELKEPAENGWRIVY